MNDDEASVERRRSLRFRAYYRMDVTTKGGFVGCLIDISTTGMRVLCPPGIDLARISQVEIVLPHWLQLGPGVEVRGHFTWCRRADSGTGIEAGFAFEILPARKTEVIEALIERIIQAAMQDGLVHGSTVGERDEIAREAGAFPSEIVL